MLIDQDLRLLLLQGHDSTRSRSKHWWFTVGGGIEPDEGILEGLRREVLEETGKLIHDFHPTRYSRTARFKFEDKYYFQQESYFTARVQSFEPSTEHLTPMEERSILGFRWWTLEELEDTTETIYPPELAQWFKHVIESSEP